MPAVAVDRTSPLPLWAQLLDDLRGRLGAGEFDERVPGELDLVAQYGVSRQTVREALRRLRSEGVLLAERGRPSRRNPEHTHRPGVLAGLSGMLAGDGRAPGAEVADVITLTERTDATAAVRLGLDPAAPVVYLERLRRLGGAPFAWDRAWLPAELARPLLGVDFTKAGLAAELAERCGLAATGGTESVVTEVPDKDLRERLDLPKRATALTIERLGTAGSRAMELRHVVVRGDRVRLDVAWRADAPGRIALGSSLQG